MAFEFKTLTPVPITIIFNFSNCSKTARMKHQCLAMFAFIVLAILFLFQLLVTIFLVPIYGECSSNNLIPPGASVNLSMDDWIYGSMWAGIVTFCTYFSSSKCGGSNFCMVLIVIMFLFYHAFIVVWSFIGITLLNEDFYQFACQQDGYENMINLGIYSGLAVSLPMLIAAITGLCVTYKKNIRQVQGLIEQAEEPAQPNVRSNDVIQDRADIGREAQRQQRMEASLLTDADRQRRSVYEQIYHRLVGPEE